MDRPGYGKIRTTHADIAIAHKTEVIPIHPASSRTLSTASIIITSINRRNEITKQEYCSALEGVAKNSSVTTRIATAIEAYLYRTDD